MNQPNQSTQHKPKSNQKSTKKSENNLLVQEEKPNIHSKSKDVKPESSSIKKDEVNSIEVMKVSEEKSEKTPSLAGDLKKSDGKETKRSSMKTKESAKFSQKQSENEKSEINKAILKSIEASGKQIKNSQGNIGSNIREYSAQNKKQEFPQFQVKKIKTQSKKAKTIDSGAKSKTQMKDLKQESEKVSIVGASKKSKRPSSPLKEFIEEKENQEEKSDFKSKKRQNQLKAQNQSVPKDKSQSKRKLAEKDQEQEKENDKKNDTKQAHSKAKSSKKSKASALKSKSQSKFNGNHHEAKSGIKKVKLNEQVGNQK